MTTQVPIKVRFKNQIYGPLILILRDLIALPRAVDPTSNALLHTFEGLILHVNHFKEKHANFIKDDNQLNKLANSIKHIRQKKPVTLETCCTWEYLNGDFKFHRMTHLAITADGDTTDAVDNVISRVNYISQKLETGLPKIVRDTAAFEFYKWAVCYSVPFVSAETSGIRTLFVTKDENGKYVPTQIDDIKLIVLGERLMGKDPTPYFPDPGMQ